MLIMWQNIELNCFAIVILLVIFLNMRRHDGQYLPDQKLFLSLLAADALLLFLDTVLWILDGKPGSYARWLNISAIVLYNIMNPVICMIWYLYVDFYVYGKTERFSKRLFFLLFPVFFNLVLSVSSIFTDIYFIFDENNVYHRGSYIHILLMICLFMVLCTTVFLIRNRKKIDRKEYLNLLFFLVPPAVGGLIQFLFFGVVVIWISVTLSILIIFINIQNNQLHTDYLTGLYNRRHLDHYLQIKIKERHHDLIAGIMLDLNSFKRINDLYGHNSGDQALKDTAQILRNTFRKEDFIARYGGDEFVVLMEIDEPSELSAWIQKLRENLSMYNMQKSVPFEIRLSIGYDYFSKESEMSATTLLNQIDRLMYMDKQREALE